MTAAKAKMRQRAKALPSPAVPETPQHVGRRRERDARGVARRAAWVMFQSGAADIRRMRETVGREIGRRDYVEITLMVPDGINLDGTEELYRRVVIGRDLAERLVTRVDAVCSELDPDGRSIGYGTPAPNDSVDGLEGAK